MAGFGSFTPGQDWQPFGFAFLVPAFLKGRKEQGLDEAEFIAEIDPILERILSTLNSESGVAGSSITDADLGTMMEHIFAIRRKISHRREFLGRLLNATPVDEVEVESYHAYDTRLTELAEQFERQLEIESRRERFRSDTLWPILERMDRLVAERSKLFGRRRVN